MQCKQLLIISKEKYLENKLQRITHMPTITKEIENGLLDVAIYLFIAKMFMFLCFS